MDNTGVELFPRFETADRRRERAPPVEKTDERGGSTPQPPVADKEVAERVSDIFTKSCPARSPYAP
jgi:hypothetical protein